VAANVVKNLITDSGAATYRFKRMTPSHGLGEVQGHQRPTHGPTLRAFGALVLNASTVDELDTAFATAAQGRVAARAQQAAVPVVGFVNAGSFDAPLHDKHAALVSIGKHLGMFVDRVQIQELMSRP
jgi:hypothetical protein